MITRKQLEEAFPGEDTEKAWKILKLYNKIGTEQLEQMADAVCPNKNWKYLDKLGLALETLDCVLNTFGVEYISNVEDTQHETLGLSYLNTGDTYTATVIYDHKKDRWLISSWGDIVESSPSSYE